MTLKEERHAKTARRRAIVTVCAFLVLCSFFVPASAAAEIVVFKNGRTMSVTSCRIEVDQAVMVLREGGEVTFPASIVARVDPDEVPYPAPVAEFRTPEVVPANFVAAM